MRKAFFIYLIIMISINIYADIAKLVPTDNPYKDKKIEMFFIDVSDKYIWQGSTDGVFAMDKKTEKWFKLKHKIFEKDYYNRVVDVDDDKVYISIATYSKEQREKDSKQPKGGFVRGPEGYGFAVYDYKTNKFKHYVIKSGGEIQSFAFDKDYMWCGNLYGVIKFIRKTEGMSYLYTDDMWINKMYMFSRDKYLWIGASEGGLDGEWLERADKTTGKTKQFRIDGEIYNDTYWIVYDSGKYWIGCAKGLASYNSKDGKWEMYSKEQGLISYRLYYIDSDKDKFWLGLQGGLMSMDKKTKKFTAHEEINKKIGSVIYYMVSDDDYLYISNPNGLFKFKK